MYLVECSQVIQLQLPRVDPSSEYETFWIKASHGRTVEVHQTYIVHVGIKQQDVGTTPSAQAYELSPSLPLSLSLSLPLTLPPSPSPFLLPCKHLVR